MKHESNNKVVIVGASIAGMMAGLHAAERGAFVTFVSPAPLRRSHDVRCQDGIAGVLQPSLDGDSIERHVQDTIVGGDFLADEDAVRRMCARAPALVRLCERMGVLFNRTAEGEIAQLRSAGMSCRRVAHADAVTGQQIVSALDEQVRRLESQGRIERRESWLFCSIVKDHDGSCKGIVAVDVNTLAFSTISAEAVVLCTGGYAGLYETTTSPLGSTGEVLTQAYLQGAALANPEFVQFHPTAMPGADAMRPMGELVRALGGRLWVRRNERTWAFLEEQHPTSGNNVPYDIAARAVHRVVHEMGLGIDGEPLVNLDLTKGEPRAFEESLSRALERASIFAGVDPLREPVKIGIAAHRSLGGLWVDDAHMTTVPGLFAAGDCGGRYHGANSLGSNVLLSSLHAGAVAGTAAVDYADGLERRAGEVVASLFERESDAQEGELKKYAGRSEGENPRIIGAELARLMDEHAGVVRAAAGLQIADEKVAELVERFAPCCPSDRSAWTNGEILYTRALGRMLALASVVIHAALAREESRGVHFRSDFPVRDDKRWGVVTRATHAAKGPQFDYTEIVRVGAIKPSAREYA